MPRGHKIGTIEVPKPAKVCEVCGKKFRKNSSIFSFNMVEDSEFEMLCSRCYALLGNAMQRIIKKKLDCTTTKRMQKQYIEYMVQEKGKVIIHI